MTVADLIRYLEQYPPDADVYLAAELGAYNNAVEDSIRIIEDPPSDKTAGIWIGVVIQDV